MDNAFGVKPFLIGLNFAVSPRAGFISLFLNPVPSGRLHKQISVLPILAFLAVTK
jgi:hypothetical protein